MLSGQELLIIGVIAIIILVFGSKKIPELAKSLGEAKHQFDKGLKEDKDSVN